MKEKKKAGSLIVHDLVVKAPTRRPWDAADWRQALRAADRGRVAQLYDLYGDMLIDTTLADALDKRTQAVINNDLTFVDPDGEEVEEVSDLIDTDAFEQLLTIIMRGRLLGRAGAELGWSEEGLTIADLPPKHLDVDRREILLDPTDERGIPYEGDPRLMVLGRPRDYGVILRAIPFAIYKRGGFGDWAQWIELFGMPQRVGKYNTYDPESKRQLEAAMERAGSAPWLIIPKEADVEVRESSASNGISFKQFVDACNSEILVGILGQTMTTIAGERGARSLGEVHREVEEAKHKSDMRYVARTLNHCLLPFLERRGLPLRSGRFAFPEDVTPVSVAELSTLSSLITIPPEWIHKRYGIPMPATEEEPSPEEKPAPEEEERAPEEEHTPEEEPASEEKEKKGLTDFFAKAPHRLAGRIRDAWTSWTTSTIPSVRLDDETTIDLSRLLEEALREVYGGETLLPGALFRANDEPMQLALSSELGGGDPDLERELRYNMSVWSAFKTHAEADDLARLLVDSRGRMRSFAEFRKAARPLIGKYNDQWLRTEYNTAVLRARSAVQYRDALRTKALYPSLEYLESDSVEKREEHLALVGTIRPIEDPWWDTHTPPLAWNCKCRIRPTDKPVTPIPKETAKDKPAPGLSGNPGRSGSVFDLKSHPYTRGQGDPHCPECRRQGLVKSSDLLDLPGDRLCPMHAGALTVKRNIDKLIPFEEMKKTLLDTRRPQMKESILPIGKPLELEGHKYQRARVVDHQVLHATRDTKQAAGKTLSLEKFLNRMEDDFMSFDSWWIDDANTSIVSAVKYIGDGDDVLKYIFRLKKERGKEVYFLDFVTIGIVARTNVEGLRKIK